MTRSLPFALCRVTMIAILLCSLSAAGEAVYSFRDTDTRGGLARVVLDDATGKVVRHEVMVEDARLAQAHKIALDTERDIAVVVNESEDAPFVFLVSLADTGRRSVRAVELASMPDAVVVHDGFAYVGCDDGSVVAIDLDAREVAARFDSREALTPPGQKPESMEIAPSRGAVLVSFQKDHRSGRREGHRVVALATRTLALLADVRLPRSMPELHHPTNRREQGPGPEVIRVCERTGVALVTIDFYGAVLAVRLDDLLRGDLGGAQYLSASDDGSYGEAFPDRAVLLGAPDSRWALVTNSGPTGGGFLVDLASPRVVGWFPLEPGVELSEPTGAGQVLGAHAGKRKERGDDEVRKTFAPRAILSVFSVEGERVREHRIETPETAHLVVPASRDGRWALVAMGADSRRLGVADLQELKFAANNPPVHAFGSVARMSPVVSRD